MYITMIRWTVVLAMGILFSCCPAGAEPTNEEGLVAHYTFDEGEGSILRDASGNGNNGVILNAKWVKTPRGGTLKFARTDSYVGFASDSLLNLAGDMTIMTWVKLEADPYPDDETNWTIVDCEEFQKSGFVIRIEGSSRTLMYRSSQPGIAQQGASKISLLNNTFYHIAVTKNGDMVTCHINGALNHRFQVLPPGPEKNNFWISGKGQSFNGLIDDLKIYERALDAGEIASAYEEQVASRAEPLAHPAEGELVLHYDFSERGGDVLHDRSGKGHDARIHGAQWVTTERGAALDFDAVDDFVDGGNPPGLRISGALTIAVWVRPHLQKKNQHILSKYGWNLYMVPGGITRMAAHNTVGKGYTDMAATQPLQAGEWNLIVAVHDPAAGQMRLFINGQPAGEETRESDGIGLVDKQVLKMGKYANWPASFNGLIGGVMIFSRALPAREIAGLHEQRPDDALVSQHRLVVKPRHYYRAKKLGAELQLQPRGPLASQEFIVRVELLDANGKTLGQVETALGPDRRARAELAMPGEAGKYKMRAVIRSKKDVLTQTTVPVEVTSLLQAPEPSWIGSQAGMTRNVPPPWTPLKTETQRKQKSVVVKPWGRRYEFEADSLISAIYVGEHNLLAAPVRFRARTSEGEMLQGRSSLAVARADADRVELSLGTKGEHPVKIKVAIDYDGMIWFEWQIENPPNPLAGLMLEVPLATKHARYFWCNRDNLGFLPDDGFTGAFLPALWLGDEERGLEWLAETDEGWHLNQPDRAIEIVRGGDRVTLRVHIIDTPTDVGKSISGSFGLQATPMKPLGKTSWDYRFKVLTGFPKFDLYEADKAYYESEFDGYVKELGIRTLTFFETWVDEHSYVRTTPEKEVKLRGMINAVRARGVQAILYFGQFISSLTPEAEMMWDECVHLPEAGWDDYNYPPKPRQKLKAVCYKSVWQDLVADGIARAMDKYDLDGVYLDGVGDVSPCVNTHHGCGYVGPDGSVRPTYPLLATRKLLQRIYKIVKSRKPEGQVKLHQSGQMIAPVLGFATSYWDGEQFGGPKDNFLLDTLPLDAFRTEFTGRQWGVAAEMLQYRLPGTHHQQVGLFLLHDVTDEGGLTLNAKLWRLADEFGRSDATWLPYWSNSDFVTIKPQEAKASLYRHPRNGVLVMLLNTSREEADVTVQLNLDVFKNLRNAAAADGITGQEVPVTSGRFSVKLKSLDWKLIWARPDKF